VAQSHGHGLGPKLALLFYIRQIKQVNSDSGSAALTAP